MELAGTLVDPAAAGIDADVLRLGIVGIHAPQVGQLQAAGALNLGHHTPQGIGVGLQQQGIVRRLSAEIHNHAPLGGEVGVEAHLLELPANPLGRPVRKAAGGIDGQQRRRFFPGKICILFFNHVVYLPKT